MKWGYPRDLTDTSEKPRYDNTCLADMSILFYKDAESVRTYNDETVTLPLYVPGLFRQCDLSQGGQLFKLDANTWGIVNAEYMFAESNISIVDSNLFSWGMKSWNSYTNVNFMFYNCKNLSKVFSRRWILSLTSAISMFEGCTKLTTVNINDSGTKIYEFSTGYNDDPSLPVHRMFKGCTNLEEINIEGFKFKRGVMTQEMFADCGKLQHIWVDVNYHDWTSLPKSSYGTNTFRGCTSLSAWDGTVEGEKKCKLIVEGGYFESKEPYYPLYYYVDKETSTLHLSNQLIDTKWKAWRYEESPWTKYNGTYDPETELKNPSVHWVETHGDSLIIPPKTGKLFYECRDIETVDTTLWDTQYLEDANYMFARCDNLRTIIGIENWNVSSLYMLDGMFAGDEFWEYRENIHPLTTLDLSKWNINSLPEPKKTYASAKNMFEYSNLVDLYIGANTFNSLGYTDRMFYGCQHMDILDLSAWVPVHFETYTDMFGYMPKLRKIYVNRQPMGGRWIGNVFTNENVSMFGGDTKLPNWSSSKTSSYYAKPVSANGYFYDVKGFYTWFDESTGELHLSNTPKNDYYEQ